ncbi:MAG TPA: NUDIX domain-containing protein [Pseudonocardiaceae bacterium]|nr:NUDIX domain-containing protein [Pseudonocardiaceae bacterium]
MVPTEDSDYHDRAAPQAQHLLPVVYAVVRNDRERVLLVRADDGYWELPGGRIEVGESASAAAVRELSEQTSVPITITGLPGCTATQPMSWPIRTGKGVTTSGGGFHALSHVYHPSPITRKPPPRHGLSRLR